MVVRIVLHACHKVMFSPIHIHRSPRMCWEVVVLRGFLAQCKRMIDPLIGLGMSPQKAMDSRSALREVLV